MASGFGFGEEPFGEFPFGDSDWTYGVLYNELPQRMKDADAAAGGLYMSFVKALAVPMNNMRTLINNFSVLRDPIHVRIDLLYYYAHSIGLTIDTAENVDFQRTSADFYAEFVKIKGTARSFAVLAAIHGFDCSVEELWYDCANQVETTTQVPVVGEFVEVIP